MINLFLHNVKVIIPTSENVLFFFCAACIVLSSWWLRFWTPQVKHYAPSEEALGEAKAFEVLLKIFESTLGEFGLTPANLASGTTSNES